MIKIGEFNKLEVVREAKFGYYLGANTENTSDDILLPTKSALGKEINIGDEVEAFIYKDSSDRIVATLKEPMATVGQLAYLEVVDKTKIGYFVDFGLERDILVPFKEENYFLHLGKKYLFYIYLDKTDRLAATTYIDKHLHDTNSYEINEEVEGTVYGVQDNGTLMVAVDNLYRGVILTKEFYTNIKPGNIVKARVKKYYEDGKMDLTVRKDRLAEMSEIEEKIMEYLEMNGGFMPYNDKSDPQDIKDVFETSKNAFKRSLGGLMKKGLITQDKEGTKLK